MTMSREELELAYKKLRTLISERDKHIKELNNLSGARLKRANELSDLNGKQEDHIKDLEQTNKQYIMDKVGMANKIVEQEAELKKCEAREKVYLLFVESYKRMEIKLKKRDAFINGHPLIKSEWNICNKTSSECDECDEGECSVRTPPGLKPKEADKKPVEKTFGQLTGVDIYKVEVDVSSKPSDEWKCADIKCPYMKGFKCLLTTDERKIKCPRKPSDDLSGYCECEQGCRPRWVCKACGAGPCYFGGEWPHVCAQDGETKSDWIQIKPDDEMPGTGKKVKE